MNAALYPPGRVVMGIWIHQTNLDGLLQRLAFWAQPWCKHRPLTVALVNAWSVVQAHRNSRHLDALRDADLCLADGLGVATLARTPKIAGADLMLAAARHLVLGRMRHVLLGGFGVARRAAVAQWREAGGDVFKIRRPWVPNHETDELIQLANAAPCDILWVALGCPRQEIWMMENRDRIHAKVVIAVGAAFDFLAGRVPRAPGWMRNIGLEWGWRLWQEPHRWRRQLEAAVGFLRLLCQGR